MQEAAAARQAARANGGAGGGGRATPAVVPAVRASARIAGHRPDLERQAWSSGEEYGAASGSGFFGDEDEVDENGDDRGDDVSSDTSDENFRAHVGRVGRRQRRCAHGRGVAGFPEGRDAWGRSSSGLRFICSAAERQGSNTQPCAHLPA